MSIRRKNFSEYCVKKGKLRLSVFKSNNHLYVQLIDDNSRKTLVSASTMEKAFKDQHSDGKVFSNMKSGKIIGELVGKRAVEKGLKENIFFDKGANKYTGVVKEIADGARSAGLVF